jgi:hypothetical protein
MNSGTNLTFERRMSPRVELRGLTGHPSNSGLARIIDISAGGAQVEFYTRLVPGNLYEMKLTFPDRLIRARALVTRSIDLHDAGDADGGTTGARCIAGLEFQGLDREEIHYLEDYVAAQARLDS